MNFSRAAGTLSASSERIALHLRVIKKLLMFLIVAIAYLLPIAGKSEEQQMKKEVLEALPGVRISLQNGKDIVLMYAPRRGEGYLTLAEKFTVSSENWKALKEINLDPILVEGKEYMIPYQLLRDEYKYLAVVNIFPEDRFEKGAWHHYPSKSPIETFGVGLWQASEWFTGRGENFQELMKINNISDPASLSGKEIIIPERLLLPVFSRPQLPEDSDLTFGKDAEGEFAGYRIKKGEALYTSVVIRFTGMTEVDDVNNLVTLVAKRSRIKDMKNIPVGQLIKIPTDLLLAEYLPRTDPRRIAYELENYEAERYRKKIVARKLEGVYVILDAGHGGVDLGTMAHGIWEHDYVYDIMCRIKRKIEVETSAVVLPIIEDKKTQFAVSDSRKLVRNKQGHILTTPNFLARINSDTSMAVNLRWYLANSLKSRLTAEGISDEKIVFASIHADSRHPMLKGAMVYFPGKRYVADRYGNGNSSRYMSFKEVVEMPYASFTGEEKTRSEALSKDFSKKVIFYFKEEGLPVNQYLPVRNRIIRHGREWIPAVLKGNKIPIKILLEVANLTNADDARIIREPDFREKVATAFVRALLDFYGES
ncbi:MAG: N-acetylmuramoyl-L-alanine amidase [Acidobacteriota bacterium]